MSRYFIIRGTAGGPIVLLNSLRSPAKGDGWMRGQKFKTQVAEPVLITAKEGFDKGTLMTFYGAPTIMRLDLYEAILSAGADNIEAWSAVVQKADGTLLSDQYVAFNVVGLVSAAGPATTFAAENPSRWIDASVESLDLEPRATHDLFVFRLAESINTVVVHENVKAAVEAQGIPNVQFIDPPDYLS